MTDAEAYQLPPLKAYWQPGCSSCLKMKEFLLEHGMEFESINVIEDPQGLKDLEQLGVRHIPIVSRGSDWANGAVFRDVARVAGFEWAGHTMLEPEALVEKVNMNLSATQRFLRQIPEDQLDTLLPGRPRTYRQLCYHVFNIPDVFLNRVEHDAPYTYEALLSVLPDGMASKADLLTYGTEVQERLNAWWQDSGCTTDFSQPGKVYYGDVSLHEVLERTGWHTGQHTRQIQLVLKEKLGIDPDGPLSDADFEGLPLPSQVWDNERSFDEPEFDGASKVA